MRLLALALLAASCHPPQPCAPAPAAAPSPTCTITAEEAQARAGAYLAGLAGTSELPPQFQPVACRSHCLARHGVEGQSSERCPSWECGHWYGPPSRPTIYSHKHVNVHVTRCGERAFTGMRLAGCLAKPHRCAVAVDRRAARESLGPSQSPEHLFMVWSPEREEFVWTLLDFTDTGEVRETRQISVHTPAPRKRTGKPAAP